MTDLGSRLELLGLSQYFDSLVTEGFDTWDTLLDITESDLTYLNFKLGHRRKLQRAIAESRGQPADRALVDKPPVVDGYRSDDSSPEKKGPRSPGNPSMQLQGSTANPGTKRKYRRHPKTDSNAPERPPSAYVIFSNQVREDLKGQELSFTEIAKVVGERWQVLSADIRENYEKQANSAKERYYSAMSDYKKTPEYSQYQAYLADFKAKHGTIRADGKRSKLETEASSVSEHAFLRGESLDRGRGTKSAPQLSTAPPRSSASSPSAVAAIFSARPRRPSPTTSAVWSESFNSPGQQEPYSPEQSPAVAGARMSAREQRAATRRTPAKSVGQEGQYDIPQHPSGGAQFPRYRPSEAWTGPDTSLQPYATILPQRDSRVAAVVPELTRQDSTISSAGSSQPQTSPLHVLPPIDVSKVLDRRLPQPVIGPVPRPLPLDHRGPLPLPSPLGSASAPTQSHAMHARHGSGSSADQRSAWPALLQATNMAREAELPSPNIAKGDDGGPRLSRSSLD